MNTRPYPMAISLVVTASITLALIGCGQQTNTAAPVAAAPPTTVGMEIDDTVVTTKVMAALIENKEIKGTDIKVETRKGVVQLSGFVESRTQADRALTVARAAPGVKQVEDRMTIKDGKVSAGNQVDDSVVTTKVKSALLADPDIKSFEIAVATRKGEVQLSGFVGTQQQIDHAVEVTKQVEGVQSVLNQISVKK